MSSQSLRSEVLTREALRHALETMEFAAFERIMKRLLYKSGYVSVSFVGRNYKRGRTPKGGLDLTARNNTELSSSLIIAQVKQYRRIVSRRFVDELRGAMLRLGAGQGLLLTLSKFSRVAHQAATETSVAPIKLIEGEEILDLLFAYRIGVVENKGAWSLDETYLDKLQERAMGTYRKAATDTASQSHTQNPPVLPQAKPVVANSPNPSLSHDPQCNSLQLEESYERGEMTWSTHLMAGLNTLWVLEALPGVQTESIVLIASAAAFGSLLPDLDASQSKIKHLKVGGIKPFYLPAEAIYHQLGHRSFLHSLPGLAFIGIVCAALSPVAGWQAALALWLGYVSHLIADGVTKSGIPLLYPQAKRFRFLPRGFRITTGSPAEEVVFVILSLSVLSLLLQHL
jgi:inner membrane protein